MPFSEYVILHCLTIIKFHNTNRTALILAHIAIETDVTEVGTVTGTVANPTGTVGVADRVTVLAKVSET